MLLACAAKLIGLAAKPKTMVSGDVLAERFLRWGTALSCFVTRTGVEKTASM